MQYRFDQLQFSSALPHFINIGRPSTVLAISGSVPAGGDIQFNASIPLVANATFSEVKATCDVTGKAVYLVSNHSLPMVWSYAGQEYVTATLLYFNGNADITITVSNLAGSSAIILNNQNITFEAIEYEIPF